MVLSLEIYHQLKGFIFVIMYFFHQKFYWKISPKYFFYSVRFVDLHSSIISLELVSHKLDIFDRMPYFISIPPHVIMLSQIKGFGHGK